MAGNADLDKPISLNHILDIAGIFHSVDNMEKRMLKQIESFKTYKKEFESLVMC
jgi:hypothetical protein